MNVSKKDILYAIGGLIKRYENGGTTPTEKERRETNEERIARQTAGEDAFGDWRGRDIRDRTPLTQKQIDLAFKGWPDDARELAIKMYEAGTLDGASFNRVRDRGEPLSLEGFNKLAFKDGDVSEGYLIKNLKGDYRKLFKQDGSYELKDLEVGTPFQNIKNELIARGAPIGSLKKVNLNRFNLGVDKSRYYGDVPVKDEVIEDEVVETTPPEDLTPVTPVQAKPTTVPVEKSIEPEEEIVEEDDEVQVVVRKKLPASDIGLTDEKIYTDTLGTADTESGGAMATQERQLRAMMGNQPMNIIKKPTNEKGGRLYDKGGKMPKALLAYFIKKQKQNMAGGGLFRVMKR